MREARVKSTSTSTGGGLGIGGPIALSTAGSVLFVGAALDLREDNPNFFWDDTQNFLGLGTNAPASRLDVRGTVNVCSGTQRVFIIPDNANLTGANNLIAGSGAGASLTSGIQNIALGSNALDAVTTAADNIAIGHDALGANTSGAQNVAIGSWALNENLAANNNTAIGYNALTANTSGEQNTAVGRSALEASTTSNNNTAFGYNALGANTTGAQNTAVGSLALDTAQTASDNTIIGYNAGTAITTAGQCTFIGSLAGQSQTTTGNNTLIGYRAGASITTATANVIVGDWAGDGITTGNSNTLIGSDAGGLLGTLSRFNTIIGGDAGDNLSGSVNRNLIIGEGCDAPTASASNQLVIGNIIFGTNIDGTAATLSTGSIGIGVTTPGAKLEVEIASTDNVTGLLIDQNDIDQIAFQIDSEATTADVIDIATPVTTTGFILDIADANSLTTGRIMNLASNSSDVSSRFLSRVQNNNASATGTTVFRVDQASTGNAVFLDVNNDAIGITMDRDVTNAANSVTGLLVQNTSVVNDAGTYAKSGSALRIENSVTETSGTITDTSITLWVQNTHADVTGDTLFINSDGTGAIALNIDAENTTTNAVAIDTTASTGRGLDIIASSLTTGNAARFYSNSSDVTARHLVLIHNDNALANGVVGLRITQDADSEALIITSAADVENIATITGDSLTTGTLLNLYSNSSSIAGRQLVQIWNDNALAQGAVPLRVIQDGATFAVRIDQNADGRAISIIALSATTDVINVTASSLTTGSAAIFYSNASSTSTRNLVEITNDNTLATNARCLYLQQDAAKTALFIDQNGDNISLYIDTEQTTTHAIQIDTPTITTGNIFESNANSLTSGNGINLTSTSTAFSSGQLFKFDHTASAAALTNKTGDYGSLSVSRTDTRTSLTTTDNFDLLQLSRTAVMNGTGGTMDADGALIRLTSTATQTLGTLTMDVPGIVMALNQRSASNVYAMTITNDNAGTGLPGGIDMSAFTVDEPLIKAPADAITSLGTLSAQIAVDVGGTVYYIPAYTTGT